LKASVVYVSALFLSGNQHDPRRLP